MSAAGRWACAGLTTGAFFVGVAAAILLRPAARVEPGPDPDQARRLVELEDENRRLRDELEAGAKRAREDADRIAELVQERKADAEADSKPEPKRPVPPSGGAYQLASVDQADAILLDAFERADPEAMIALAAALLAMGEPGYEKLLDLLEGLEEKGKTYEHMEAVFPQEILASRFVRAALDHQDDVAKFLLWLEGREPDSLPEPAREVRKMMHQEMGPILLGVYGGDDPEVHDGFVPIFERQLQGDESEVRRAVAALAQLRSERAADLLIGLLDRTQGRVLQDVVVALAYQASPRAAAALRAFAARNTDPEVAKTLGIALLRFR